MLVLLLTAVPTVQADEIYKSVDAQGNVVYSDHAPTGSAGQDAVRLDAAEFAPQVLHFCWTHCFTLRLESGRYTRSDDPQENWTIERFTSRTVILHRHDAPAAWNNHRADVIYAGQVAGDRLFNITIDGHPAPGVYLAWGRALDTLPGSNAERDQRSRALVDTASATDSSPTIAASEDLVQAPEAPPPPQPQAQPPPPQDGDIWMPGYWTWRGAYYWMPGTWVRPPRHGLPWTPGHWDRAGGVFVFHPGHWGEHESHGAARASSAARAASAAPSPKAPAAPVPRLVAAPASKPVTVAPIVPASAGGTAATPAVAPARPPPRNSRTAITGAPSR